MSHGLLLLEIGRRLSREVRRAPIKSRRGPPPRLEHTLQLLQGYVGAQLRYQNSRRADILWHGVHVPVYSKRLHASRANPGSESSTEAIMILLHSHSGHQLTAESGKCMSARAKELPLNVVVMFLLHTAQAKGTIISWGRKSSRQ
jgi:hypothetical protein